MNELALIGVITESQTKWRAFDAALVGYPRTWINDPRYDERNITHGIPHNLRRPHEVARGKADHDFAAFDNGVGSGLLAMIARFGQTGEVVGQRTLIGIYHDVVRYLPDIDVILGKSQNRDQWFEQLMLQRGQEIWICPSHRLRRVNGRTDERAVDLSIRMQAKKYNRSQVLAFGRENVIENLLACSGGMPMELAAGKLLEDRPLEIFIHENQNLNGRHFLTVPNWTTLPQELLLPFHTGAFTEVLVPLIQQLQ